MHAWTDKQNSLLVWWQMLENRCLPLNPLVEKGLKLDIARACCPESKKCLVVSKVELRYWFWVKGLFFFCACPQGTLVWILENPFTNTLKYAKNTEKIEQSEALSPWHAFLAIQTKRSYNAKNFLFLSVEPIPLELLDKMWVVFLLLFKNTF